MFLKHEVSLRLKNLKTQKTLENSRCSFLLINSVIQNVHTKKGSKYAFHFTNTTSFCYFFTTLIATSLLSQFC